jgi:hypothetical protein
MRKLFSIALMLGSLQLIAQDATVKSLKAESSKEIKKDADTSTRYWKKGGLYSINFSQGSLKNWAAGGDEFSLSVNSLLSLYAFLKKDKHSWDNSFDFNLGLLRSSSLGTRKNDDRIDLLSKYGRSVSKQWNVASLFNFRTQLLNGYSYDKDQRTLTSAFLSPAYILAGLGMDYKPNDHFSVFISPATARWVIVKDDTLSAKGLYGVMPGKHSRSELGAFLSGNYLKNITTNLNYKGRLDLFSNYKNHPENIDVFFSNLFSVKLWKFISATWNVDMIYDDDVRLFGKNHTSPEWQIKSLVGVGMLVKF